jgi:hypothetical protein
MWVWEAKGGVGKTMLAKWLIVNKGAFYLQNGKNTDIAHAYRSQEYVVVDLTRSQEGMFNYGMLESFKNGIFFSPKYESQTKIFKPAKIVVFANWEPDKTKLSADRWDVHHIANLAIPQQREEEEEQEPVFNDLPTHHNSDEENLPGGFLPVEYVEIQ